MLRILEFLPKLMLTVYTLDIFILQSSSLFLIVYFVHKWHIQYKCNLFVRTSLLGYYILLTSRVCHSGFLATLHLESIVFFIFISIAS